MNDMPSQSSNPRHVNFTLQRGPFGFNRKRRVRHQIHRILSIKAGMRSIEVEGVLQADAVFYFEGDPSVRSFTEQDPRLPVPRKGSPHTTMAFSVRRDDGTETFIDVKPESTLVDHDSLGRSPKNWDKLMACASIDQLAFITDLDLAQEKHRISNWRTLLPFVRSAILKPDDKTSIEVYQIVLSHGQTTINELAQILPLEQKRRIPFEVARLLHRGKLDAALGKRVFTLDTPITTPRADPPR